MNYEHYYFLMHAFDRLGRRMYPDDWTGNEIGCSDLKNPKEIEGERAPLEEQLAALDERYIELEAMIKKTVEAKIIEECKEEQKAVSIKRSKLHTALWETGTADESYRNRYAAIPRRDTVRNELLNALRSRMIEATVNGGTNIELDHLENQPGFSLDLEWSMARLPSRDFGGRRRHASVLLNRKLFNEWLDQHHPEKAAPHSREENIQKCKRWFREQKSVNNRLRKQPFIDQATTDYRISEYAAEQIWAELAGDWKNPGRPKNTKK